MPRPFSRARSPPAPVRPARKVLWRMSARAVRIPSIMPGRTARSHRLSPRARAPCTGSARHSRPYRFPPHGGAFKTGGRAGGRAALPFACPRSFSSRRNAAARPPPAAPQSRATFSGSSVCFSLFYTSFACGCNTPHRRYTARRSAGRQR